MDSGDEEDFNKNDAVEVIEVNANDVNGNFLLLW